MLSKAAGRAMRVPVFVESDLPDVHRISCALVDTRDPKVFTSPSGIVERDPVTTR